MYYYYYYYYRAPHSFAVPCPYQHGRFHRAN
jgi:hypothetical protein